MINELEKSGSLNKFDAQLMRIFVEGHDYGYSVDLKDAKFLDKVQEVWQKIGRIVGYSEQKTIEIAQKIRDMVAFYSNFPEVVQWKINQLKEDPAYKHLSEGDLKKVATALAGKESYMVSRVIAHGTTSIVPVMEKLKAQGFDENQALGLALMFAAHHTGYPITMVNQFVIAGIIPAEYVPVLLITDLPSTGVTNTDESLRQKMADASAQLLNIPPAQARYYATLGYALDRITPARMMSIFHMNTFDLKDDGSYTGQIIWSGAGETIKKYPLIITNIKDPKQFTVSEVFRLTILNLQKEAEAAIKSAELMNNGLPEPNNELASKLRDLINQRAAFEINQTQEMHQKILTMLKEKLPQFSGDLTDIDALIRQAVSAKIPMGDPYRASLEYLLGFLITIKTSALAQDHIKSITGLVKKQAGVDQLIANILKSSLLGAYFDEETLAALIQAPGVSLQEFAKGKAIITQGELGGDMYVIQSGDVNIIVDDGKTVSTVATRHAGEILGEIGALTGVRRTATVIAASDKVTVVHIPASEGRRMIEANVRAFLGVMQERLASQNQTDAGAHRFSRNLNGEPFKNGPNASQLLDRINGPLLGQLDAIDPNLVVMDVAGFRYPIQFFHNEGRGMDILRISETLLTAPDNKSVGFLLDLMKHIRRQGSVKAETATEQAVNLVQGYFEFLKEYIKANPKDRTLSNFNLPLGGLIEHYRNSPENQIALEPLTFLYNFNSQLRYFVDNDERLMAQIGDLSKNLLQLFTTLSEFPIAESTDLRAKIDVVFLEAPKPNDFLPAFKNMPPPDTGFYAKEEKRIGKAQDPKNIQEEAARFQMAGFTGEQLRLITQAFSQRNVTGAMYLLGPSERVLVYSNVIGRYFDIGPTPFHQQDPVMQQMIVTDAMQFMSDIADQVDKAMKAGNRRDNAAFSKYGGIDFNSANLHLQIKRDGNGVPFPLAQQDMAQLSNIQGFIPEIIEIRSAVNIPILSELQQKLQSSSV